jgi:outer membrane protein assembly factor BamB
MTNVLLLSLLVQDWTTLHRDPQRSGFSEEVVRGPYERKWYRDFHDEMIASRVEAIVAEGKCFVGTFAGNLHALDLADGKTVWTFKAGGGHRPFARVPGRAPLRGIG